APVYERMGFVDHGLTTVMGLEGDAPSPQDASDCHNIAALDFDEVVAFDASRFGAARPLLLAALISQNPERVLVLRRGSQIVGYLVAQERALGPVIADD